METLEPMLYLEMLISYEPFVFRIGLQAILDNRFLHSPLQVTTKNKVLLYFYIGHQKCYLYLTVQLVLK